jgi:hypothetical protein
MVKVIINEGFSSLDGSWGPGENEMPKHLAEKYACFVTIIEEEKPKKKTEKVAVKMAATPTVKKVRKPRRRK